MAKVSEDEIIEEGVWCTQCRFFEPPDEIHEGRCNGCGCGDPQHIKVAVVKID